MDASPSNPIAAAAFAYAQRGWAVIPVIGKVPQGGKGWPDKATKDPGEAECLFDEYSDCDGVGVVLGARSGIIDIECDNEAAEVMLGELFSGDLPPTPTFQSTRGLHRIFAWTEELPESERHKSKFMVGNLEIRSGGGDKAAQTVFPPSNGRDWILNSEHLPPAQIPAAVLERMREHIAAAKKPRKPAAEPVEFPTSDSSGDERLDVTRWLARHAVEVLRYETQGNTGLWFIRCPGIDKHTTPDGVRDCIVTQEVNTGKLGGHCFHASCGMSDWQSLSEAIGRPTYQDYHGAPEPILEEAVAAIMATASPAAIQQEVDEETKRDERSDAAEQVKFPENLLNVGGILKGVVDYTLQTSMYRQPELALASAIALLGSTFGRKVTDRFGTRTNVYVLGLGESGVGKERARQVSKELLLRSGADKTMGSERIGSHAGIVSAIFDSPVCLMQLDEFGRLLETMRDPRRSPHLYNCITVLMQLYTSANSYWKADAYADSKKVKQIDQPHLCLYGTATPASFWNSLTTDNISEGLVGRLMVFPGRGYAEVDMRMPDLVQAPADVVDALRWWSDYHPGGNLSQEHPVPVRVEHSEESLSRFVQHISAIAERRKQEHPLRAALWSRSGEKVAKLALIHACSRSVSVPSHIELEDIEWAIAMSNWLTRYLLRGCAEFVSESMTEGVNKKVLREIPFHGIDGNSLARATQFLTGKQRRDIVNDLVDGGYIQLDVLPSTGGRPKQVYKRIRNP